MTTTLETSGLGEIIAESRRAELRLVVAGSVDDGKSTLVGRLLHDTKSILADQFEAVEDASRRRGSEQVDLALLTDGLRAEREQGITIDVAYRYFSTPRRTFVLADTPGHTQYTRNTVTGASTAQAAVILVDVRNGVSVQTRRHAAVMALLRVPHVVFAVNKMDAVGWDEARFDDVAADLREIVDKLRIQDVSIVPVSALTGQNVAAPGEDPDGSWYTGEPLLTLLEELDDRGAATALPFRMPVQLVIRPRTPEHPDYRGLGGRVGSGTIAVGDEIVAMPGKLSSVVTGIDSPSGPVQQASAGESVTILLRDDLDVGRGQVLVHPGEEPMSTDHLTGVACWLAERPLAPRQRVLVKAGTKTVRGLLQAVEEHWDVETQEWIETDKSTELNDIVRLSVRLSEPVAVDDYSDDRTTGGFLVIDPATGATLAAGMVGDPLTQSFDPSI